MNNLTQKLAILSQYLVPQKLLSRSFGFFAESKWPLLKNFLIHQFIQRYQVDMTQAENPDPSSYGSFNDFFTRALKPQARPIASGRNAIVCPADGHISQIGIVQNHKLLQAKGHHYSLNALLGDDAQLAQTFTNGSFLTTYLSPKDYHRVHMPLTGTLIDVIHVPGRLFSVSPMTVDHVPDLFARNERVICIFKTAAGLMAVILVGAMIVASIETQWSGIITPINKKAIRRWHYSNAKTQEPITLQRGEEMGRFKAGSTVIVLFEPGMMHWQGALSAGQSVQMGQSIGLTRLDSI